MAAVLDFVAYIGERTKEFTGREWVLAEIDCWLADGEGPTFFIITGEPGVGKTALAAQLTQVRPVAAHHFCIARDMNTVDPVLFARSLARQLCQIDGFAQEILKESKIELKTVQNIQANYGQVIGARIETLVINAPSGAAAFTHAVLQPLKALCTASFAGQLVLVVDALDEAVQRIGETIVDLLANAGVLPRQVRVVLTSRPEGEVLRHFEERRIPHLLLDAGRPENLADLRRYTQGQVAANEALGARLAEQKMAAGTFVERVVSASRGNFLYLVNLLPAIADGSQRFDTLEALPQGLDGIYHGFLLARKTKDTPQWRRLYEPVLGVLVAAQEPLTRALVEQFTGLATREVRYGLQDLQQFLDPVSATEGRYFLYHQSIRDWLQEERRAQEFWVDGVLVHRQIAINLWNTYHLDWSRCDHYALIGLAIHLYHGQQIEQLHSLISQSWMNARFRGSHYTYNGFLADLKLAWQSAYTEAQQQIESSQEPIALVTCVRYALIRTTINSLARSYIPELVVRALQTNLKGWTGYRALSAALDNPNLYERCELMSSLVNSGCLTADEMSFALDQAVELISRIEPLSLEPLKEFGAEFGARSWSKDISEILVKLAPRLTIEHLRQILPTTLAIHDESFRSNGLVALAPQLSEELLSGVLQSAIDIVGEPSCANVLVALAPKLKRELLEMAFAKALTLEDEEHRNNVIAALIPQFDDTLIEQVLEMVIAINDEIVRADGLVELAPRLDAHTIPTALKAALSIKDEFYRTAVLVFFLPYLSADIHTKTAQQALKTARDIRDISCRVSAFTYLASILKGKRRAQVLQEALASALRIEDDEVRVRCLIDLSDEFKGKARNSILQNALEAAYSIDNCSNQAHVLIDLVPILTGSLRLDTIEKTLGAILSITDPEKKADALASLVSHLNGKARKKVQQKAIEATKAIQNTSNRALSLTFLAAQIPELRSELLHQAVIAALSIEEEMPYTITLVCIANLASRFNGELSDQVLKAVIAISDDYSQSMCLSALTKLFRGNARVKAVQQGLTAALAIDDQVNQQIALAALAPMLDGDFLEQALMNSQVIDDRQYVAEALTALIPHLEGDIQVESVQIALQSILKSLNKNKIDIWQMPLLHAISIHLGDEELQMAMQKVQEISDNEYRSQLIEALTIQRANRTRGVLSALKSTDRIEMLRNIRLAEQRFQYNDDPPSHAQEQELSEALKIDDIGRKLFMLRLLAPRLNAANRVLALKHALTFALSITNEYDKAFELKELSHQLTGELLETALSATLTMEEQKAKATVLAAMAPMLSGDLLAPALEAALNLSNELDRAQTLVAFLPVIPKRDDLLKYVRQEICDHLIRNLIAVERREVLSLIARQDIFAPPVFDHSILNGIAKQIIEVHSKWKWVQH